MKEWEAVLVLKQKREIGNSEHYKYRNLLKELDKQTFFLSIDPDFPAQLVIENSIAVISMPFTSTALIGKEMGKPSIYYDPCGMIQKEDIGAHGIETVTGKEELKKWIRMVMQLNFSSVF